MGKPLVSFCVKSYNQRPYLRAALEGALAQTYRPLEIVVSDDASTDGSWELIEEILGAVGFEAPPQGVSVVLNRNETNRGNLGNWEKICELAKGELLINSRRGLMLGPAIEIPDRLVQYRLGSGATTEEWDIRSLAPHHCDIFGYQQLAFLMPRPIGSAMLFLYVLARNAFRRLQGGAR